MSEESNAATDVLELIIPINPNTIRKIVALAALTGSNLATIKSNIASEIIDEDAFDKFVSSKLQNALMALDGIEPSEEPEQPIRRSSFAQAEQEALPTIVDEIAGHSLSHDEDMGEPDYRSPVAPPPQTAAQSQRVQPAREAPQEEIALPSINAPDVGDNADAFLDAAMGQAPQKASSNTRRTAATNSFSSQRVRAKVSEYTESGDVGTEDPENLF